MSYTLNENSLQLLRNRFEDDETFTYYGLGCAEYTKLMDDVEDKLHYWIEECNCLDGFMVRIIFYNSFFGLHCLLGFGDKVGWMDAWGWVGECCDKIGWLRQSVPGDGSPFLNHPLLLVSPGHRRSSKLRMRSIFLENVTCCIELPEVIQG